MPFRVAVFYFYFWFHLTHGSFIGEPNQQKTIGVFVEILILIGVKLKTRLHGINHRL